MLDRVFNWAARSQIPGWYRLLSVCSREQIPRLRVRTRDGLLLRLDPTSHVDAKIIRAGYYERPVLDAALRLLPRHGVFWDVGANLGLHSLTVSLLRPDVHVVAFEPSPLIRATLNENAVLNRLNPLCIPLPLSDETGLRNFSISSNVNAGLGSLTPWPDVNYEQQVGMLAIRGDDAVSMGVPAPDVIKIDVEGAECLVLRGLDKSLRNVSAIILECDFGSESSDRRDAEIREMLGSSGFTIARLRRNFDHDPVNFVAFRADQSGAEALHDIVDE